VHGNSKSASNALDAVGDDLGSWTRRGSHRQNYHIDPLTYKIDMLYRDRDVRSTGHYQILYAIFTLSSW